MMHTTLDIVLHAWIDGTQVGVFERAFDRLMSCRHTANSSIDLAYQACSLELRGLDDPLGSSFRHGR